MLREQDTPKHYPVLYREILERLDIKESDIVFDGTVGLGGHGLHIIKQLGQKGVYIGTDVDPINLIEAKERLGGRGKATLHLFESSYKEIDSILSKAGVTNINKALLDLGFNAKQLESGKGFSFQKDEPLLMTYGHPDKHIFTAKDIVNTWSEENIADILYHYADERRSRKIASAIVESRREAQIETTKDLVNIISKVCRRSGNIHEATRTFQALRIATNDEIGTLRKGLPLIWEKLEKEGMFAVISFHSIEDRFVKQFFAEKNKLKEATLLTKKPIVPSQDELKENKRSRSAKLRIAIKK
ncbi:MAG: 16S rRNA (cytosine(1402)-N(4))-methyltransferase RsmH [Candidatus Campbellbacteria bacterium]|nr:16S rRNA (cytosine(1402)-N(4))-methyltransferase RsmH [Candidatus Campbellbacteria bacterium]